MNLGAVPNQHISKFKICCHKWNMHKRDTRNRSYQKWGSSIQEGLPGTGQGGNEKVKRYLIF